VIAELLGALTARMSRRALWLRVGDGLIAVAALIIDGFAWQSADPAHVFLGVPVVVSQVGAAVAAIALVFRRARPTLVHGVWAVYGLSPIIWPTHEPFIGLLVSLYTVSSRRDGLRSGIALACSSVPLGVNAFNTATPSNLPNASGFALAAVLWGSLGAAAWAIGRPVWLSRRRAELREEAYAAERATLLRAERLRVARELHDVVAHSVTAIVLQASGARAVAREENGAVRGALAAIETAGSDAMHELHRLLGLLRAVDDEPRATEASPLTLDALSQLIETTRDCGVDVHYAVSGDPVPLDPTTAHTAYRVLQESLTNVIKYAGTGSQARVSLDWLADTLTVTIFSQGSRKDSDPTHRSGGFGLLGLRERLELLGGRLEAGPVGDHGFATSAVLPIAKRGAGRR
jgi:signal transduction histidine kinase